VAVELTQNAELLTHFDHPENALYVFGPEDGSLGQVILRHCHRFLAIPAAHCLNLAAAVNVVLYDRRMKRQLAGLEDTLPVTEMLKEHRGFISNS
jgi:tRNA(Leu) C34 or U34 (ribose-2'-O)-methylase TrmL